MNLHRLMTSAALAALLAGGALAQETAPETGSGMATEGAMTDPAAEAPPAFTDIRDMTVGDVVGMIAFDPEGSRIAEIDYVVEGPSGPEAVLGIGGFLGLGEYTVALPLSDFELNEDGSAFTLGTDKETLEQQPEFDESSAEGLEDDVPIASLMQDEPEGDAAAGSNGAAAEGDAAAGSDGAAAEGDAAAGSDGAAAEGDAATGSDGAATEGDAAAGSDGAAAEGDAAAGSDGAAAEGDAAAGSDGAAAEGEGAATEEGAGAETDCPEGQVLAADDSGTCVPAEGAGGEGEDNSQTGN